MELWNKDAELTSAALQVKTSSVKTLINPSLKHEMQNSDSKGAGQIPFLKYLKEIQFQNSKSFGLLDVSAGIVIGGDERYWAESEDDDDLWRAA